MTSITSATLYAFFERLLRPVVRILLRHGVSLRELSELCKRVCVSVASSDLGDNGKPMNTSRIALLTGMTRRDVRQVRLSLDADEQHTLGRMNSATRLLAGWFQDADFLNAEGRPMQLQLVAPFPSFTDLSKRYAGDIPVTTVVKELKRAAAIEELDDGIFVAKTRYYMPGHDTPANPEAMIRAGSVYQDLGNTVDYNLGRAAGALTRFERRATNSRIDAADLPEFHRFIEHEGQKFLELVDRWLSEHEVHDENLGQKNTVRLGLGAYWIEGPDIEGAGK